tara:strand:+ start:130 stop:324 length:195 start_codon:yes stop_codon:yes gene_type:complete
MKYNYTFNRDQDVDYTGQFVENITTQILGADLPLNQVCSGIENFAAACGFELNGSGIGLVSKPE